MFSRRILHHGSHPDGTPVLLSDRVVGGCWFELHRQGGCGSGELTLREEFPDRESIKVGDWLSFEATVGDRWYLGRVEERRSHSPAGVRLRLEGMGIQLNEVFPGGFGPEADGRPPHRYARTQQFSNDPDRAVETFDSVEEAVDVVRMILQQYVVPQTQIQHAAELIETPEPPATIESVKFRGEESARAILKDLALRAQASWGVDEQGRFFFLQPASDTIATWREGRDLVSLTETTDREHLFNRVLLTGDYVYDTRESSGQIARRSYRWRGNFVQPESRTQYGERRIRLWIPWIRTQHDTITFVREFFRNYSKPTSRYLIETVPQSMLPRPWLGRVRLQDRSGNTLVTGTVESLRVSFDHSPRFRLEIGPEDPRNLWPEPPHDERWELPETIPPGGDVLVTDPPVVEPSEGGGGHSDEGGMSSVMSTSMFSSDDPSDGISDSPSDGSSDGSSNWSSDGSWDASEDRSSYESSWGVSDDWSSLGSWNPSDAVSSLDLSLDSSLQSSLQSSWDISSLDSSHASAALSSEWASSNWGNSETPDSSWGMSSATSFGHSSNGQSEVQSDEQSVEQSVGGSDGESDGASDWPSDGLSGSGMMSDQESSAGGSFGDSDFSFPPYLSSGPTHESNEGGFSYPPSYSSSNGMSDDGSEPWDVSSI